ncbi:MAG: hypothetical protein JW973_05375 [Bacteroidales bacterium]|nr:hypothetical protein [Bacteroidales bacterium]
MKQGYFDGDKPVITVALYPFQYFPEQKTVRFFSSIAFTVIYDEAGKSGNIKALKRKNGNTEHQIKLLEGFIENKDAVTDYQIKSSNSLNNAETVLPDNEKVVASLQSVIESGGISYNKKYVVITSSALAPCLNDFMAWKRRKGIDIGLVTVEDIYNNYSGDLISGINDNAGKIRQFLSEAWSNGLLYAFFGGDNTVVPVRYGCGSNNRWHYNPVVQDYEYMIPADLYFADFNGDWDVDGIYGDDYYGEENDDDPDYDPEIYVGRIMCRTCSEVDRWTRKLILYEKDPGVGDNIYLTKSFMTQADQLQSSHQAETLKAHLPGFTHNIWAEQPSWNSADIPTFPTGNQAIAEMNNNYGLQSWFGHGVAYGVHIGTKGDNESCHDCKYNIVGLNSVDEDDNISDNAITESSNGIDNMTNINKPGIVYTVACTTTPFDRDFFHPQIPVNLGMGWTTNCDAGGPEYLGNTRFGWVYSSYLLYAEFADLISNGSTYHLGEAEGISKSNYLSHYLSYSNNLVGCPETEIWTDIPSVFNNVTITDGGYYVTVNTGGVTNCNICVQSAMDNGTSFFQNKNGPTATFNHYLSQPYLITITKHNYIPYIKNPDNIYIQNETISSDKYIFGKYFYAGSNVTPSKPQGPVYIQSGSAVVFDAENTVSIQGHFEVQTGALFEVK